MVQTPLRAGIASFAHVHAPAYAAALREIPGATLGGIWDEDAERGRSGAEACGTTFYARLDELLANVDAAIVASENTRHRDLVLAAAAAKVHVLCERRDRQPRPKLVAPGRRLANLGRADARGHRDGRGRQRRRVRAERGRVQQPARARRVALLGRQPG